MSCCTSIRRTARRAAPWSPPISPTTRTSSASATAWCIGVSRDDCLTHADFRDRNGVTIALLSDPEGEVCRKYGVIQEKEVRGRAPRMPGALHLRHRQERRHPPRRLRRQPARPRRGSVRPGEAPAVVGKDTVVSLRVEMHDAQGVKLQPRPTSPICTAAMASCWRRSSARSKAGAGAIGRAAARARGRLRRVRRGTAARRARRALRRGHRGRHGGRGGLPFLHGHRRRGRQSRARRQPSAGRNGAALLVRNCYRKNAKAEEISRGVSLP